MIGYFKILTVISLVLKNEGSGKIILSSPINIAVKEGEVAEFECQVNAAIIQSWSFTPVGSSTPVTFHHGIYGKLNNQTSFYNSTSPDGRVSVKTKSVRLEDAGIYQCNIQQTEGNEQLLIVKQRSAQLIVLASEPRCSRDDSNDRFRCSVDYRGNWVPVLEWRRDGPDGPEVTGGLQDVVTTNQSCTFILFVGGKETNVSSASVFCRISFSFKGNPTGTLTAHNVPKYTPVCPDSDKSSTSRVSSTDHDKASNSEATNLVENKVVETNVSLVTFVVSLASVIIAVLILLIVYHVFLKKFVLGRRLPVIVANDTHQVLSAIDHAQGSEYAIIPESHGLSGQDSTPLSMQGSINSVASSAYIELVATDDWGQRQQQIYRKLQTVPENASIDDIPEDVQTHPYVNFPLKH